MKLFKIHGIIVILLSLFCLSACTENYNPEKAFGLYQKYKSDNENFTESDAKAFFEQWCAASDEFLKLEKVEKLTEEQSQKWDELNQTLEAMNNCFGDKAFYDYENFEERFPAVYQDYRKHYDKLRTKVTEIREKKMEENNNE